MSSSSLDSLYLPGAYPAVNFLQRIPWEGNFLSLCSFRFDAVDNATTLIGALHGLTVPCPSLFAAAFCLFLTVSHTALLSHLSAHALVAVGFPIVQLAARLQPPSVYYRVG